MAHLVVKEIQTSEAVLTISISIIAVAQKHRYLVVNHVHFLKMRKMPYIFIYVMQISKIRLTASLRNHLMTWKHYNLMNAASNDYNA